jgi:hypothetical protein
VLNNLLSGIPAAPTIAGNVDQTSGIYFGSGRIGISRHTEYSSATNNTPVITACGTTPTLGTGANDTDGTITMGTTATGCVITFGTAYTAAPNCTVTWQATPLASQSYTVSATAITLVQTSTTNNKANWHCSANQGG